MAERVLLVGANCDTHKLLGMLQREATGRLCFSDGVEDEFTERRLKALGAGTPVRRAYEVEEYAFRLDSSTKRTDFTVLEGMPEQLLRWRTVWSEDPTALVICSGTSLRDRFVKKLLKKCRGAHIAVLCRSTQGGPVGIGLMRTHFSGSIFTADVSPGTGALPVFETLASGMPNATVGRAGEVEIDGPQMLPLPAVGTRDPRRARRAHLNKVAVSCAVVFGVATLLGYLALQAHRTGSREPVSVTITEQSSTAVSGRSGDFVPFTAFLAVANLPHGEHVALEESFRLGVGDSSVQLFHDASPAILVNGVTLREARVLLPPTIPVGDYILTYFVNWSGRDDAGSSNRSRSRSLRLHVADRLPEDGAAAEPSTAPGR